MKTRHPLAVLMLFVCLNIFGQQSNIVPMQGQPQTTSTQVSANQQETIKQLQAENEAINKQLKKMDKDIELYRGDVRNETSRMNTNMALWLAVLTIIMAILGVAIPLILSKRNEKVLEKMLEDVKQQANSAELQAKEATTQAEQAKKALVDIEELNKHVTSIEEKINKDVIAAKKAAKKAKASQLFTEAVNEKDPSRAIELFDKAININPNFLEAFGNRGNLKTKTGDHTGALADYGKVIELNPDDAKAYLNRGYLKNQMGDQGGAQSDYDMAISLKPDYAEAYNNRGILKYEMGDQGGAQSDYDMAISLKPDYAEAYNNRGILKCEMDDQGGAQSDYDMAISLKPDYAKAYNNRAVLWMRKGDLGKAMDDITIAIENDNRRPIPYVARGGIYLAMDKAVEAIRDFDKALSIKDDIREAYEGRAKCYRKLAETEQDPAKETELIAKAEADERKAESLKKGGKA